MDSADPSQSLSSSLDLKPLEALAGTGQTLSWNQLPSPQVERFTQALDPETGLGGIVTPETQEQLAAVVAWTAQQQVGILPYGNGSKLHWGGLVRNAGLGVGTARLNRLVEHAVGDLTVTVEAGMKFADLQGILAAADQFLPLDPAYPDRATIGGIIATADTGSLRHRYRGVRDILLGISFVRADGQLTKAGGRVVKNVAGYDLMKLLTGSYGTLGMITQATLRVYPMAEASGTVILTGNAEAIAQATQTLLASALTPVTVDLLSASWVKPWVKSWEIGIGPGLIVGFQGLSESVQQQSSRLLEVGEKLGLRGILADEPQLWRQFPQTIWNASSYPKVAAESPATASPEVSSGVSPIRCKIGILPTAAVATLMQSPAQGWIHAGVGLGILQFEPDTSIAVLEEQRRWCQAQGGFFSILEAPIELKQRLDPWGYTGNAWELMGQIKQKFDPQTRLSPQRFSFS
ncbi:MAG: FAD-binding oxidoreductase [Oscillatoriales cyanobacterium RM2_1_1]|nr:FAD-binding oxidoreductase [Oscillatoriales cyanobacterium RM2_1_1]